MGSARVEKDGGGIWSGSGAREEREITGNTNFDGGGDYRAWARVLAEN